MNRFFKDQQDQFYANMRAKEQRMKDAVEFFKAKDFAKMRMDTPQDFLPAIVERANQLLAERGVKIYTWGTGQAWDNSTYYKENGEVEGLLIDVRPIVKDTAESLLREAFERAEKHGADFDWMDRARKLLDKP